MAGSQIDLMPGEDMILYSNPHWWYFWKDAVAGLIFLGLLVLLVMADDGWLNDGLLWLTVIAFLVFMVMTLYAFVQWRTTKFAITSERVAYQSGIIRRRGVSIPLNRINNVNFNQTMIARMLNNGVVIIESAGETGDSVFENIPEPEKVRALIFKQVEVDEQRDSDRDAAALAKALRDQAGGGSSKSVEERLAELDQLHDSGVVSDEEYAAKRDDILGSL